jgi:hypothetical protein
MTDYATLHYVCCAPTNVPPERYAPSTIEGLLPDVDILNRDYQSAISALLTGHGFATRGTALVNDSRLDVFALARLTPRETLAAEREVRDLVAGYDDNVLPFLVEAGRRRVEARSAWRQKTLPALQAIVDSVTDADRDALVALANEWRRDNVARLVILSTLGDHHRHIASPGYTWFQTEISEALTVYRKIEWSLIDDADTAIHACALAVLAWKDMRDDDRGLLTGPVCNMLGASIVGHLI